MLVAGRHRKCHNVHLKRLLFKTFPKLANPESVKSCFSQIFVSIVSPIPPSDPHPVEGETNTKLRNVTWQTGAPI